MKKLKSLILFGVLTSSLQAQELAMVGFPTIFDQTAYAARLAYLSEPSVGLALNNRFVKELNVLKIFGAYPLQSGVWSGMYKTFGYAQYREHSFGMGLSKIITPRWALALQAFPKIETFGKEYASRFSMDLNATSFAKLSPNLYWDSEINLPIRLTSNTRNDAPLQSFLRISMSYVFSKRCQTSVHIKQQLPYKTEVHLQLGYVPVSSLMFFGIVGSSGDCGFGVGYVFEQITCRFQAQYRSIVGYSTTVGVSYPFTNAQKINRHDF